MLNSPSNPTGMVLSRSELEAIAAVLRRHPQVAVVCDEIYEFLLAPGHQHHSLAAVAPDLADRIFSVNGFAKGWAMTGWRIGWLAGNSAVLKAGHCPAEPEHEQCVQLRPVRRPGGDRRIRATACRPWPNASTNGGSCSAMGCRRSAGLQLQSPQGAFYAFPDVSSSGLDSMSFCNRLLDEQGLAVVPGVAFGDDRCIRLSCAAANSTIEDGLARLERLIRSL